MKITITREMALLMFFWLPKIWSFPKVGTDPKEARYWLKYFSASVDEYNTFAVVCVDHDVLTCTNKVNPMMSPGVKFSQFCIFLKKSVSLAVSYHFLLFFFPPHLLYSFYPFYSPSCPFILLYYLMFPFLPLYSPLFSSFPFIPLDSL